jgi:hypothetical protein
MLRRLGWCLLVLGLLAWPAARVVDAVQGTDVTLLARLRTPEERSLWMRSGWDPTQGLAALYGVVDERERARVVCVDEERLIRPSEDPTQCFLLLDALTAEELLTARALRYRAALLGLALGLVGALLLLRTRSVRPGDRTVTKHGP